MNSNKNGFTLIEFLVAIVILMVGLLGLLQAVNVALQYNMTTQLRNEAVAVADEAISQETAKTFAQISAKDGSFLIKKKIVSGGFRNYSVQRSGTELSNSKHISIQVSWQHKGVKYVHETAAVVSKHQ